MVGAAGWLEDEWRLVMRKVATLFVVLSAAVLTAASLGCDFSSSDCNVFCF